MKNLLLFAVFAWLFSVGCQTNQAKQFEMVKAGQEKGEILEIMGSPDETRRWHGMDRWTYRFYDDEKVRQEREVHFLEGKSVYVGNPPVPKISAEEQDAINEQSNVTVEKEYQEKRKTRFDGLGDFEEYVRGTKEIRASPVFEEIQGDR